MPGNFAVMYQLRIPQGNLVTVTAVQQPCILEGVKLHHASVDHGWQFCKVVTKVGNLFHTRIPESR